MAKLMPPIFAQVCTHFRVLAVRFAVQSEQPIWQLDGFEDELSVCKGTQFFNDGSMVHEAP
jgi:hypothetical protein